MSQERRELPKSRQPCNLPEPKSTNSFWHTEPSSLLLGHRSTRSLPETADVVVIGSGMTGTSVAHHLLTEGPEDVNVVLLEAREACWGATGRNGGHCQPILYSHPHDPSIGHFELKNFHTLQRLIQERNIDCEFYEQPSVHAFYNRSDLDEAELALHVVKEGSPELAAHMRLVLNKDELNSFRVPSALGALVTDIAARVWPYKFVSRILEDLITSTKLNGTFNLQTLTPVDKVWKNEEDGNVNVQTGRGTIVAKKVVLATNAYTSHLLHDFADLIVPVRGQMSALIPFPSVRGEDRLKSSHAFITHGQDDYLIQRPNERGGHLMFGGGRRLSGSIGTTNDNVLEDETVQYLRSRLISFLNLPEGGTDNRKEMDFANVWTGIMGFSRDEKPWVGPLPDNKNTFVAAGFTGHGMPNTWLSGKAVATMVSTTLKGKDLDSAIDIAGEATGLPKSYLLTKERLKAAMLIEDVEARELVEWQRAQRARRPSSGYA